MTRMNLVCLIFIIIQKDVADKFESACNLSYTCVCVCVCVCVLLLLFASGTSSVTWGGKYVSSFFSGTKQYNQRDNLSNY